MQETWVQSLCWEYPWERNGNALQYSCLGNPTDRRACPWSQKSQTWFSDQTTITNTGYLHTRFLQRQSGSNILCNNFGRGEFSSHLSSCWCKETTLAIWPSNPTPGHTHQGNQIWKRHVNPNVHRSTVYNRTWKQPRCPSADEWIRKLWYIYTMEYYSAIKNNSFESVLMRWMKLEPIIQSEVSQKDKDHYSILTHIYGI